MERATPTLTDGGDTVRERPLYLCPESEHWLDWFHITMRLTVMSHMTKGWATERDPPSGPADEDECRLDAAAPEKQLEGLERHLWHRNVHRACRPSRTSGGTSKHGKSDPTG